MEKTYFPQLIEAEKVLLKKHTLDLAETMFQCIVKDRKRLQEFLPWVNATNSNIDTQNFIKSTINEWETFELFDYGIFEKESNVYVGNLGVHTISWSHHHCELGYWITQKFEGKGFILDAVTAIEKVCFQNGFNRIEIRCSSKNHKSASVPKRLAYNLEGELKQSKFENGKYIDNFIFAKLNSSKS